MIKLARRMFTAGGPVHGVAYGIFTAVLATTARRTGLVGRAAAAAGLVSAATGILSLLYFRWENAGWLIPAGRFLGIPPRRQYRGTGLPLHAGRARPDHPCCPEEEACMT